MTFPAASPGFVQLQTEELTGSLEATLMFRTGQRRGMLAYLQDADRFFYASLALVDGGALELRVFPQVNQSITAFNFMNRMSRFGNNTHSTRSTLRRWRTAASRRRTTTTSGTRRPSSSPRP